MTTPLEKATLPEGAKGNGRSAAMQKVYHEIMEKGTPVYQLMSLEKEDMEAFYTTAHDLYEQEKFQEACVFFQWMCFYDISDKRAWMGAGGCLEALNRHSEAVSAYACAAALDGNDTEPYLRAFNCFLETKNKESALNALDEIIRIARSKETHNLELIQEAETMKKALVQTA